jgi:tryptophan halogenase
MIVKHICIVGGGSAGWMTAFALMRSKPEIKVTLIESPDIETIGVGESLLQHFQEYVQLTGLDDREWMPACDATFKTSISFTDWTRNKGTFQYPFGDWNFPKYENKLNNCRFISITRILS